MSKQVAFDTVSTGKSHSRRAKSPRSHHHHHHHRSINVSLLTPALAFKSKQVPRDLSVATLRDACSEQLGLSDDVELEFYSLSRLKGKIDSNQHTTIVCGLQKEELNLAFLQRLAFENESYKVKTKDLVEAVQVLEKSLLDSQHRAERLNEELEKMKKKKFTLEDKNKILSQKLTRWKDKYKRQARRRRELQKDLATAQTSTKVKVEESDADEDLFEEDYVSDQQNEDQGTEVKRSVSWKDQMFQMNRERALQNVELSEGIETEPETPRRSGKKTATTATSTTTSSPSSSSSTTSRPRGLSLKITFSESSSYESDLPPSSDNLKSPGSAYSEQELQSSSHEQDQETPFLNNSGTNSSEDGLMDSVRRTLDRTLNTDDGDVEKEVKDERELDSEKNGVPDGSNKTIDGGNSSSRNSSSSSNSYGNSSYNITCNSRGSNEKTNAYTSNSSPSSPTCSSPVLVTPPLTPKATSCSSSFSSPANTSPPSVEQLRFLFETRQHSLNPGSPSRFKCDQELTNILDN